MAKNKLSPPLYVALVTEKSTATEPIFIKRVLAGFQVETTRSLWEAAKWDSKLQANKSLAHINVIFLPHRVRISLTLE
jgi:hypothetical protein